MTKLPFALATMLSAFSVYASDVSYDHLPPLMKWTGASEQLIQPQVSLQTPIEKSGFELTPTYEETKAYAKKLATMSKLISYHVIGRSPQGREIFMLKVSADKRFHQSNTSSDTNTPVLLVHAGIHSGEIDGKDAGFMWLRDLAIGNKPVPALKNANMLFIPILSVDGHERSTQYSRVNQRGPSKQGWRTNAQNLNLNRDFSKLDTLELRALMKVINDYSPTLYLDVHVTDGEDYQYDITYGFNREFGSHSPEISTLLQQQYRPAIDKALETQGHIPGPLVFGVDRSDFSKGIAGWAASPRYSNGYGDVRHLPTILVENHSLKPYKQRVLGTYVFIDASLTFVAEQGASLKEAIANDTNRRRDPITLAWKTSEKPDLITFKGIEYKIEKNDISGSNTIVWLGKPKTYNDLPIYWQKDVSLSVKRPSSFYIPPQYSEVVNLLQHHGIEISKAEASNKALTQLTANDLNFGDKPFEGRTMIKASFSSEQKNVQLPSGSWKVSTDQKLGDLAIALLYPEAPDSFFSWGFFNSHMQPTEYIEPYAMIPIAKQMLADSKELRKAFEKKLESEPEFAKDPAARLRWFYLQTPYADQQWRKYPIYLEY